MSREKAIAVASFVDLALKYRHRKMETLRDRQTILDMVCVAGFFPKCVVHGELVGYCRNVRGNLTGLTYTINGYFPFKVVSTGGYDDYFATAFVECAFRRVVCSNESREKLVDVLLNEIKNMVVIAPIQLTPDGDLLREYPPSIITLGIKYLVEYTREGNYLCGCVGVHEFCGSWMNRMGATATHDAIVCEGCYIRVLFPKEVRTYGDLRRSLGVK